MLQRLFLCLLFFPLLSVGQDCAALKLEAQTCTNPDSLLLLHQQAAACWLQQGDTSAWIDQWSACNSQLMAYQRYPEALHALETVAAKIHTVHPEKRGWLFMHMGYQALTLGDVLKARDYYQRSADFFHKNNTETFVVGSYCYRQLGNIYTRLGELEKARKYLERFLQIAIDEGEEIATADAFGDLSIVLREQGDTAAAHQLCLQALELPNLGAGYRGDVLLHLAECMESSDPATAMAYALEAQTAYQGPGAGEGLPEPFYDRYRLAMVNKRIGHIGPMVGIDIAASENALRTSIRQLIAFHGTHQHRDVGKGWLALAELFQQTQPDSALACAQNALLTVLPTSAFSAGNPAPATNSLYAENTIVEALLLKAAVMKQLHRETGDSTWLHSGIQQLLAAATVERLLKSSFTFESSKLWLQEQGHSRAGLHMDFLWELYQLDPERWIVPVLNLFESTRANLLLEAQNRPSALLSDSLFEAEKSLFLELQEARRAVAQADPSRVELYREVEFEAFQTYEACRANMAAVAPEYAAWKFEATKLTIANVREWLETTQTDWLVEYYQGPVNTWVLAISQDSIIYKPLVHTARLLPVVKKWLPAVSDRELVLNQPSEADERYVNGAQALGRILITNVLGPNVHELTLAISPDGTLQRVPFEVLIASELAIEFPVDYRVVPYLLRTMRIQYVPSLRLVRQAMNRPPNEAPTFAAFAADYSNTAFAQLGAANDEAVAFAESMNGQYMLGATTSQFLELAAETDVLHLGLHGIQDFRSSEWSYLAFTPDSASDGKLYVPELYAHRINARLAVLGACNTAAGDVYAGEGVMSISRGFAHAGCASVVVSLWPLPDATSTKLLAPFYTQLKAGASVPAALQQARLSYLETVEDPLMAHPLYWASLVSSGAGAPVATEPETTSVIAGTLFLICIGLLFIWRFSRKRKAWKRSNGL